MSVLKLLCILWIQDDLRKLLDPPLLTDSKADCGFNHPVLAKMLCPGRKQNKLVEDPEYVFHLLLGRRRLIITIRYINELKLGNISDEDIPTFCYKSGSCNLENLKLGLFKGTFLLHVRNTISGSSEHKNSIVFFTDVLSDLHRAIVSIESKTWPSYKE